MGFRGTGAGDHDAPAGDLVTGPSSSTPAEVASLSRGTFEEGAEAAFRQRIGTATPHRLDGSEITTSAEAMTAIAEALSFPDTFGNNLDALYDCLTDLSWLPPGEHALVWTKTAVLRDVDRPAYDAIRTALSEAVTDDTPEKAFLSVFLLTD
ncbi:barstar family protein [Planomonospora sp. ID91781]|uniref:barstar family protein n=1 Tax=Planomonospora sp. ID91781 TaxID=2738135 RepID=UPI0027DC2C06|nr:barstar family protein [Planomonospora sp. ID91781]